MNNKNRQDSIVASVLKRNNDSSRNPLERTLEAYKLDKTGLDDSFRLTDFEDAIATKVAEALHKYNLDSIKTGNNDTEFNNVFETDEVTKFYTDELKGLIGDVGGMSRSMLKNQLARMDALMETLADSDSDKDNFLLDQYAQSVTFLEDEYKRKSNVMMRTQTFMGNLASEYLDVQSLYSGFVDHNPLAMGLFKLGKNALDDHRTAKMERKQLVETDLHRQEQARNSEQLKEIHLAEEQKRADELYQANLKAGNITDDNNNTNNSNTSSKSNVREGTIVPNTVVESKITNKVSGTENNSSTEVKADEIRDDTLARQQFKLQESTYKTTAKWQKDVIKKLNKLHLASGGVRGRKAGIGLGGAGAGKGMLDGLGGTVKTVGAGLVGAMGATMAATGALATTATVGVGAAVGTAIGTGISKGYESLRGGKGSIGSDFYDLINDNATIQNLEKRKVIDRDLIGDSELDRSKLGELHADELKALLQLKDFDKGDTQAIMKALKKKTDERLKRIEDGKQLQRDRHHERVQRMTPSQRVREFGFDPIQRDNDNASYLKNSLANRDKPLDMTTALKPLPTGGIDVDKVMKDARNRANGFSVNKPIVKGSASVEATKKEVYDQMKMRGLPEHIIQGIMMNMQDESGFKADITEAQANVHGTFGKGLYQLTGSRRDSFEAKYGNDYSVSNQIENMMQEFQTTEKGAYNKMLNAKSSGEVGQIVVEKFLRPAKQHQIHRGNKYLNSTGNFYDNPNQVKTVNDFAIPVQNNGVEKVQHIEKTIDMIEEKKEKVVAPVVISQQANSSSQSSGGSSDSPSVPSARNNDSSLSRVTDRYVSQSMV